MYELGIDRQLYFFVCCFFFFLFSFLNQLFYHLILSLLGHRVMTLKKKPRDSFSSNLLCHDHLFNRPMFIAALAVIIFSSMEGPDMERATIMAFLCNSIYPVGEGLGVLLYEWGRYNVRHIHSSIHEWLVPCGPFI